MAAADDVDVDWCRVSVTGRGCIIWGFSVRTSVLMTQVRLPIAVRDRLSVCQLREAGIARSVLGRATVS